MKEMKILAISLASVPIILTTVLTGTLILKASPDDLQRTEYLKNTFNMTVEDDNNIEKINGDQALDIAHKLTSYSATAENVTVTTSHKLLSFGGITPAALTQEAKDADPALKNGINELPVWIITYDGVKIPSKGNNSVLTEDNIVIDASTGEFLFGFR